MYISYMLYQVDHVRTAREQREEDVRAGEVAAEFGRLWQSLAHPRVGGRRGFREAPEIEMIGQACATCPGQSAA
ncbi:MAG TPA: hypothetical protein VHZ33_06735 [Trebonia sp.]|jgi:hypothetical protein|nr:hypothetical protein [Trebonia sp.]